MTYAGLSDINVILDNLYVGGVFSTSSDWAEFRLAYGLIGSMVGKHEQLLGLQGEECISDDFWRERGKSDCK